MKVVLIIAAIAALVVIGIFVVPFTTLFLGGAK